VIRRQVDFPDFARALVLVFAATAAIGLAQAQSDTWWHVRAGRDIWHDHTVSLVDRYSHTVAGTQWPDHEWLWQATAYALHQVGGMPLLALVNGVLAVGAVVLALPRGPSTRVAVLLLMFVVAVEMGFWAIRPQVASLFLFALLLRLLRRERFWWVPPLMLLWANLHGAVATGGVVLVASTLVAAVVHLRHRSATTRRRLVAISLATAASAVATLVTPLGWRLWTYVFDSIGRSKDNGVQEWSSAFHLNFFAFSVWVWLFLVGLALVVGRGKVTSWSRLLDLAVVLVLAPLSVTAIRNVSFLALAALPLTAELLRPRQVRRGDDRVPAGGPVLAGAMMVGLTVVLALWARPIPLMGWQPIRPEAVAAVRACPGPIYNTFGDGGVLIWFAPEVKVFVDNRQDPYPSELIAVGAGLTHDTGYEAIFDRYDIACAFVHSDSSSASVLLVDAGWQASYDDGTWTLLEP